MWKAKQETGGAQTPPNQAGMLTITPSTDRATDDRIAAARHQAEVSGRDQVVAAIRTGLLVLVGVERGDTEAQADRLLERLLTYRVFPDTRAG